MFVNVPGIFDHLKDHLTMFLFKRIVNELTLSFYDRNISKQYTHINSAVILLSNYMGKHPLKYNSINKLKW